MRATRHSGRDLRDGNTAVSRAINGAFTVIVTETAFRIAEVSLGFSTPPCPVPPSP